MTSTAPVPGTTRSRWPQRLRAAAPWIAVVVVYLVIVVIAPGYVRPNQIGSLLQLASILGVVAIGQTLVILVGGIDLSVGAVMTLGNVLSAAIIGGHDANLPLAVVVNLAVGALIGLVNGVVITALRIPELIVTLATMTVVLGAGYLLTGGAPRGSASPLLIGIVTSQFLGVLTVGTIVWLALGAATIVVLRSSTAGRRVYAIGLNRTASHVAGIRVNRIVIVLYVLSGAFASLAGLMLTGYSGSVYLGSGDSYQLSSIAAVVLGGASIFGGRGGYGGTIAGVVITVLLLSGLQVIGIAEAGQDIVYGVVIVLMLIVFTRRTKELAR